MARLKSILLVMFFLPVYLFSQHDHSTEEIQARKCGHHEYIEMLTEEDPGFPARREMIEHAMQQWIKDNPAQVSGQQKVVYTIPVVVHVLYNSTIQNVSHNRILEQIAILNKDFRKLNTDIGKTPAAFQSKVADIEFQFCLAQRDPQGNWTNGVTRRQVTQTSFSMNDDNIIKSTNLGGTSIWNASKYLNIWVVNLTGGVLGYTQPPGGQASKDGVVICYKYFGQTGASAPFNKGRTATHEIGHWFNLIHVWGDDNGACWGSDLVGDTPNQASEFYGCPSFPQMDICTPDSPGVMFMNYMDYVDDDCMVMFTTGQKTRMVSALNAYRSGLKTSDGCEPAIGIEKIPDISDLTIYPNPGNGIFNLEMYLNIVTDVELTAYNMIGQQVWQQTMKGVSVIHDLVDLQHLEPGVYLMNIRAGHERRIEKIVIQ
jgi:hypothetical protein